MLAGWKIIENRSKEVQNIPEYAYRNLFGLDFIFYNPLIRQVHVKV